MALNPNIILAQNAFDPVGAYDRGRQMGQVAVDDGRRNALAGAVQQYGPGAISGDQQSVNALARFDPGMAQGLQANNLGMDAQRLGMDQTRQNMAFSAEDQQMARDAGARAAQESAARMSADQVQAELAQGERVLAGLTQAQSPEQWDAFAQAQGQPELVGQFESRDMIFAMSEGARDALKSMAGPDQPNGVNVGGALINPQTGAVMYQAAPEPAFQRTTTIDPATGQVTLVEGNGPSRPLTEAQSKDVGFATRGEAALDNLDAVEGALTNRVAIVGESVPLGLGRVVQTPEFQLARQAGNEFIMALLRKDTGAAITEPEQAFYGELYLPRPGDGPEVIEQKRAARRRAIEAIKAGLPPAAIAAQEKALANGAKETVPVTITPAVQSLLDETGISAEDFSKLTPEQQVEFLE